MTTQTLDPQRDRLLALHSAERVYEFLHLAEAYLDAHPDDDFVRIMAVREYLGLHLAGPAGNLLESTHFSSAASPEFQTLHDSMSKLTTTPTGWERYSLRFDANLSALSAVARHDEVPRLRDAWSRRKRTFQLFIDRRGVHHVRRSDERGRWNWFPIFADHRAADDAHPLPQDINHNTPGPYLFEGLGHGRFFERVYRATLDTFLGYSCPLYVVEPDPAALAVVLHLNDWRTLLADPRVMFFIGDHCLQQLRSRFDADRDLPWPQNAFTRGPFPAHYKVGAVAALRDAGGAREVAVRESLADLERHYAARDIGYWAARFAAALSGRDRPLRILAAVSTHTTFLQHSMRDARRAFESLGHEMRVLTEDRPYTIIGPLTYHKAIREFDPDLFFILDHLRPECEILVPKNLPILTWDQDQLPHVFTKANLERIARHDFIAGCSKYHCVSLGFDPRQFLNVRVPTCPEQFSGDPLTEDECRRYACDVSYVSHASQTPRAFHEQERASYGNPGIARLLDVMYELLPDQLARYRVVDGGVMNAVLGEACRRCGVTTIDEELGRRLCRWYLWRLGDRMFRHEALEWVAAWASRTGRNFRIYGNGWDKHPTLSGFAAGPAHNGRELLCVHRASKINLQLMPAGFVHQRSLDGLTAGGFFLGRYVPDDLRGRTLRRLVGRIDALGIRATSKLLGHHDDELQRLLREYVGERLGQAGGLGGDLLTILRTNAELAYPDEVFGELPEILFDSAEQFAALADQFLSDEPARLAVAERMRAVVIERYSYRPTMNHMLHAMAEYLHVAATPVVA